MNSVRRMASFLSTDKEHQCAQLEELVGLVESESEHIGTAGPEPPISTRTIAIGALLAGLFLPPLVPLGEMISDANAWRSPAVGFHKMELITPVVHIGQPLVIKTHFQYLRVCNWNWVLEWKTAEGKSIAMVWHWGSAHAVGEVGEHEMPFPLPDGIKPGNYLFVESATGTCDHGEVGSIPREQVAFTVIN